MDTGAFLKARPTPFSFPQQPCIIVKCLALYRAGGVLRRTNIEQIDDIFFSEVILPDICGKPQLDTATASKN